MIDIQGELLLLKQQRKQEYISVAELADFLKKHNPESSYQEIATYLLIKLSPNDIRKTDDEIWGNEEYNLWQEENGIAVYHVPKSIDEKETWLQPDLFFTTLEALRNNNIPNWLIYDDIEEPEYESAIDYLKQDQIYIYAKRKRIEELLNFNTLEGCLASELDENQSKPDINTDEKDSIIAQLQLENAELQARISELENKTQKSAVDSNDFSIYGHKSELLDILFKVIAEFWADSETPPKNSVIEQWIETNYPVKDYPYVSKAVRQYIATILRPQPKLK